MFDLDCVNVNSLQEAQSKLIYREMMDTPPPPRVTRVQPDLPWDSVWPRLEVPSLDPLAVDLHFSLLHDLLPVRATLHHLRMPEAPSPDCLVCRPPAPPETSLHFFTQCSRVSAAWHFLFFKATMALGVALTDTSLLHLAWPPTTARVDASVTLAVITFTHWAWASRGQPGVLAPPELQARVREAASGSLFLTIL